MTLLRAPTPRDPDSDTQDKQFPSPYTRNKQVEVVVVGIARAGEEEVVLRAVPGGKHLADAHPRFFMKDRDEIEGCEPCAQSQAGRSVEDNTPIPGGEGGSGCQQGEGV